MSNTLKIPPLNALILIGGKSTRMGKDKSLLTYFSKPQWEYLKDILKDKVQRVYLSVRQGQIFDYPFLIEDKEKDLGPFGAILSAIESHPEAAFLVIATDLPFVDENLLEKLILARDTTKDATALKGITKDYPEPLACIWEPTSFSLLKEFYEKENYRLIRVLKSSSIHTLPVSLQLIQNINTPEEYLRVKSNLQKKYK